MFVYLRGDCSARSRRIFQQGRAAEWRRYALECLAAGEDPAARRAIGEARRALTIAAALGR